MGTEYYIVKNKELYYLGKGNWSYLQGFNYDHSEYLEYETYDELFLDMLDNDDFSDFYVEQVRDLAYNIFEWCNDKVMMINDCSNDFTEVSEYPTTGSICEVYKNFKKEYQNLFDLEEQLDELVATLPEKYWVKNKNNVILRIPTLQKYIKEAKC